MTERRLHYAAPDGRSGRSLSELPRLRRATTVVALLLARVRIALWRRIEPGFRTLEAVVATRLRGFPARRLQIIAVTGTDGKTTTCHLIASVLRSSGARVGVLSTVALEMPDGTRVPRSALTTPNPPELHAMLRQLLERGAQWVVLEVSSHALALHRTACMQFRVAVVTTMSHDHLDFHGSLAKYAAAKARIFRHGQPIAVVGADCALDVQPDVRPTIRFGLSDGEVQGRNICSERGSCTFDMAIRGHVQRVRLPLTGSFNTKNALAAASVGTALGLSTSAILSGLESVQPLRGRVEWLEEGQQFGVVVDYAHAPGSLAALYSSLRALTPGRLIAVLGADGGRDRAKRLHMGRIAGLACELVILTDLNPRWESPLRVIRDIEIGLRMLGDGRTCQYEVVTDREQAIRRGLELAQRDDAVVITGLGHETSRTIGGKDMPWSDQTVTRAMLTKMRREATRGFESCQ